MGVQLVVSHPTAPDARVHDGVRVRGSFIVRMYSMEAVCDAFPNYRERTKAAKARILDELRMSGAIVPIQYETRANTTCVGLHEFAVQCLDASQPSPKGITHLSLGRSEVVPSESDTSLNDPVDDTNITVFEDEGTQIRCTIVVDEGEANVDVSAGETISEVGLYASTRLLNHSVLANNYAKDQTKTMTVSVLLSFEAI